MDDDIREAYSEDTIGRKYHASIITKNNSFRCSNSVENSEVKTLNLNRRILKPEFRKMSDDDKKAYILFLRNKYGATDKMIAECIGISTSTMVKLTQRLHISYKSGGNRPKTLTQQQKEAWETLLNGGTATSHECESEAPKIGNVKTEKVSDCDCLRFVLRGVLNTSKIAEQINNFYTDGTMCEVSVTVRRLNNEREWR